MAARARDRPHALLRHDPAAGGDRDDERHQRRLPHRLLCRADPFRRLGADRRAPARDRRRRGLRVARRRLAARLGRSPRRSEPRRRARAPRRFRLGDGHRADADLSCPLRPAAAARLRAICGLRRPCGAVLGPVRIDGRRARFVATAPTILFAGIVSGAIAYTIQIFAQAHTPPAEAALILALEGVFAALAGALLLERASDRHRRSRLRADSCRRGGGGDSGRCSGERPSAERRDESRKALPRRGAADRSCSPGLWRPAPRKGYGRAMAEDHRPALPASDRQRQCPGPRPLPARLLPTWTL